MAITIAAGAGLWATWDSTQTSATSSLVPAEDLLAATTTTTVTTTTPIPACRQGDDPVEGDPDTDWATIVIDGDHRLAPDYAPDDLVEVTEAGFETQDQVRRIVIADLAALRVAAEATGTPIVVVSGYRSYSYQQSLFDELAAQVGEAEAAARVARPGHSEHQLGTAVDVLTPAGGDLTPEFGSTPAGKWLAAHAHRYGFVLSYPANARDRTCYAYEPWHLRYVGRETAGQIHESEVTAREWMIVSRARQSG